MARKSSRRKKRRRASAARSSTAAKNAAAVTASKKVDLIVEDQYVIEDLKCIGIIAVILIGGLVILSFFL